MGTNISEELAPSIFSHFCCTLENKAADSSETSVGIPICIITSPFLSIVSFQEFWNYFIHTGN